VDGNITLAKLNYRKCSITVMINSLTHHSIYFDSALYTILLQGCANILHVSAAKFFQCKELYRFNRLHKDYDPDDKLRLVSFDIQDMSTNIRVEGLPDGTDTQLQENFIGICTRYEIVRAAMWF
jgi:hypothetical protein